MNKSALFRNAGMAILQLIVSTAIIFFLYRFLLQTIGVKQLGIWSLVLASSSVSRIASLGLGGSIVKFVAKYIARKEHAAVALLIQTTMITMSVIMGAVLLLAYPLLNYILVYIVDADALLDARAILPVTLLSVWLTAIAGVMTSGLDGYQRIHHRSILTIVSMLIYTLLCVLLVQHNGLMGLAVAQIGQYAFLLITGYLLLRKDAPLPLLPYQWDRGLCRETIAYGANFQLISLATMLYEPVTKGLLARLGGLELVGYYEMATRLVMQLRGLVLAGNQVVIPVIADLHESDPSQIERVYTKSVQVTFFISVYSYTLLAIFVPSISTLWLGFYQPFFVWSAQLLISGWFINTLSAPAYFAFLGSGRLKWLLVAHVAIGVLNALLGWALGALYGGAGIITGWAIALVVGSLFQIVMYQSENKIAWATFTTRANGILLGSSIVAFLLNWGINAYFASQMQTSLLRFLSVAAITALIMLLPMWIHPVWGQLQAVLFNNFARRQTLGSIS